jgi:hypothetical protein
MAKWPTHETEVAEPVVAWLQAAGWDVYQEVKAGDGRSCDIVATRGPLLWVVEAKVRLNAEVVEQARWWRQYAHYASVAVPYRSWPGNAVINLAVGTWGIGVFGVHNPTVLYRPAATDEDRAKLVTNCVKPSLNRQGLAKFLRLALCEEQRTYLAAGSPCGGGWSPYKATCRALERVVIDHPGCTLREAIVGAKGPDGAQLWPGITHHYSTDSTANSSLKHWLEAGKVPGVRLARDGQSLRLYPQVEQMVGP